MFGHIGRILRVDLSSSRISVERVDKDSAIKYLGGKCLGTEILYKELEPGIDPFSAENKLIFITGPLQGTIVPGSGRFAVISKSPETFGYGESHAGGNFGPGLKSAGYDAIIVEGRSEEPVYLNVWEDGVEIRSARRLWGKNMYEVERVLRKEIETKPKIVCIGTAGERLVRFASILNNLNRAAARAGMGAVMGSKNLKAIAVTGTKKVAVSDEEGLRSYVREVVSRLRKHPGMIHREKYGTAGGVPFLNELGVLPTKNFQMGFFSDAEKIDGRAMTDTILVGRRACYACPIACNRCVEVKVGPFAPVHPEMGGPEYETCAAFGSLLLNNNLESIAKANELCNLLGIDTISTGVLIAFAMECYEKGIISIEEADGVDLTWGNPEAIVKMVQKIGDRDGIGDILAEGVKRASERIGKGSQEFAMHIKGLEVPLHEPRAKKGLGLGYLVSNVGARHMEAEHDHPFERDNAAPEIGVTKAINRLSSEGQPYLVKRAQEHWSFLDSLILCKFISPVRAMTFSDVVEMTRFVMGFNIGLDDLMTVGERSINVARAFNIREGFMRKDDCFPPRFYEPLQEGVSKGSVYTREEVDRVLDEYYLLRGWDIKTGRPTKEKLMDLDLDWLARDLEKRGLLP